MKISEFSTMAATVPITGGWAELARELGVTDGAAIRWIRDDHVPRWAVARLKELVRAPGATKTAALARARRLRADLLRGARVARQMGFEVTTRRDQAGRLVGYELEKATAFGRGWWWISDRELTPKDFIPPPAPPYNDPWRDWPIQVDVYAADTPIRRPLWWRRALTLLEAGRGVPG